MNKKELKLKLTKKIYFVVVIGLLWIFGTIYFLPSAQAVSTREKIKLIFSSIGGFGIVCATVLNVWNSLDVSRNNLKQIEFKKIENSMKYLERWDSTIIFQARNYTRQVNQQRSKIQDNHQRLIYDANLLEEIKHPALLEAKKYTELLEEIRNIKLLEEERYNKLLEKIKDTELLEEEKSTGLLEEEKSTGLLEEIRNIKLLEEERYTKLLEKIKDNKLLEEEKSTKSKYEKHVIVIFNFWGSTELEL